MLSTIRYMLALTGICAALSTANACSSLEPEPTDEQLFAKASAVFVAHIVRTEETEGLFGQSHEKLVEATFDVMEALKGDPPSDRKIKSFVYGPGNCSVPLLAGIDYLILLREGNWVLFPYGSQAFSSLQSTEAKQVLAVFRGFAKP
jgi:hypothetical protein